MILAGTFGIGLIVVIVKSGFQPVLLIDLFPIGIGIASILWLGRTAYIKADGTSVQFVPPVGMAMTVPKASVVRIVRVLGSRGSARIESRDANNDNLLVVEQYFARDDLQRLAQYLGIDLSWGPAQSSFDTKISSARSSSRRWFVRTTMGM